MRPTAAASRITITAIATVGVAACSLTTDFSGLSGGAEDAVTQTSVDGSPTSDVASSDAASSDAASGDATSNDAGPDANVTPFLCADHPGVVFCSDFEGTPVSLGWDSQSLGNGGGIASGTGHFGLGLVATSPARTTSNVLTAAVGTTLPIAQRTSFTMAYAMKLGPVNAVGALDLTGLEYHAPYYVLALRITSTGQLALYHHGDGTGAVETIDLTTPLVNQPALGEWIQVVMKMTFSTPSAEPRLNVALDGVVVFDDTVNAGHYVDQSVIMTAGISRAANPGKAFEIDIDDVLVTSP